MKAYASVMLASQPPEVKLEHNGEILAFSISVFGRANFSIVGYDVFEQINLYWESLPEIQQTAIFKIYKEVQIGFDSVWHKNDLVEFLTGKVKDLFDIHNLDALNDWVTFRSNVIIPETFTVDYTHSVDNNTSREKTYTRSDYAKLITLSLAMRVVIPIWGEYIANTRQDTGTTFKEFYAFQLLSKSTLAKSIPLEKLKTYIDFIVGDDKYDPNQTLNSLSSEDVSYWLLSLVCIRRLCVGDIRGLDPKANLVTFVYKYIIQKIRNNDSNFENLVKEKVFSDKESDAENKISTLERYKVKTNLSLGEIVELEFSIRNMFNTAIKLSHSLDHDLYERSQNTSHILNKERLLDPQMTLLRWVFKPVISAKGLMYLPKPLIVQALGALESILWARNHKYLALLATSFAVVSDKEMSVSPVDSKMRVPKELTDELDRLYPFTRTINSKKAGAKEVNLAAKSIDILTDNLTMFSWKSTASESMLEEVFQNNSRRLPIKPDIKIDLTKLVIELGNRSWK